ncbi:MAG: SprT family zinc-dependent metalloprotease [Chloroflexota bacterium]|nr:SprT family zinc-dependent metalloprotease [Chloroflexota bacterium]
MKQVLQPVVGIYKSRAYTVITSKKARRTRLKISPRDGLTIIIPEHAILPDISSLLADHSVWIERVFKKLNPIEEPTIPHDIEFKSIDEQWNITYIKTSLRSVSIDDSCGGTLICSNIPMDPYKGALYLNKWVNQRAKETLTPWIDHVSKLHNIPYNSVNIRRQKTRWGSCSSSNRINLNQNLLFLDPDLVTYVILHELVHTEVPNHSSDFWGNLDSHIPKSKVLQTKLRGLSYKVPQWAWL